LFHLREESLGKKGQRLAPFSLVTFTVCGVFATIDLIIFSSIWPSWIIDVTRGWLLAQLLLAQLTRQESLQLPERRRDPITSSLAIWTVRIGTYWTCILGVA